MSALCAARAGGLKQRVQHHNLRLQSWDETVMVYKIPGVEGAMVCYDIFPGIQLCFSELAASGPLPEQDSRRRIMEINYCRHGRHECEYEDHTYSFMGEGDLCINMFEHAPKDSRLPLGYYEGVTIYVDLERAAGPLGGALEGVAIDLEGLCQKLGLWTGDFYLPAHPSVNHIFAELYEVDAQIKLGYFRLKVLELLLFLVSDRVLASQSQQRYYPQATVEAVKAVKNRVTANYQEHIPMEQLAAEQGISLSALKSCFRDIYGQPLYSYLKRYRIQMAAKYLREGAQPIAWIANAVGYESAGKFAQAFKAVMGCAPSAYRKTDKPFGL